MHLHTLLKPFVRHFFFLHDDGDLPIDDTVFKQAESKVDSLSQNDLYDYLREFLILLILFEITMLGLISVKNLHYVLTILKIFLLKLLY